MSDKRKPQVPGGQPQKPQGGKPIKENGNFQKRDAPQGDRYKPSFDPKPGGDK